MIDCYLTTEEGTKRVDAPGRGCWVVAVAPTPEERSWLGNELGIAPDFLMAALDAEESPHTDFDDDTRQTLIILDCPSTEEEAETLSDEVNQYDTTPLSIIMIPLDKIIVTICRQPNSTLKHFTGKVLNTVDTSQRTRLLLRLAQHISQRFQVCLRDVYKQFIHTESQLQDTLKNRELIKMLSYRRSLVYFSTSINADQAVLRRVGSGSLVKLYEEDSELLDDVNIEFSQAEEMCSLYDTIIRNTADGFSSVINNNMNATMRMLTGLTLLLAIPTIVFSFYGMNVEHLPGVDSPLLPVIAAIIICVVAVGVVVLFRTRKR